MIQDFLQMLKAEKGLSFNTVDAYQRDLMHFQNHIQDILGCTKEDILSYLSAINQNRTAARRLSCLKQFFLFLKNEGMREDNPAEKIKSPKWQKNLPKILSEQEVDQLFEQAYAAKDLRLCAMLEILYATGMRISELISLKKSHFSEYNNYPILKIIGKGDKERLVPLNPKAVETVREYLKLIKGQHVFPSPNTRHLTRQRVFQLLKELAVLANIDPEKISPHVIRHAFATHMLKRGADLVFIKEVLGHSHLSTSEIYLHVLPEDLEELITKHHPLCQKKENC